MSWKRLWFGLALPSALVVGAAGCQGGGGPSETKEEAPKVVQANLETIHAAAMEQTSAVVGTIKPLLKSTLSSKVTGRVTDISVREGDVVQAGQMLVSIDSRELASALIVARANDGASQAGIGSAVTAADIEARTSQARLEAARSQVEQAKASMAAAEARRDQALNGPRSQELIQASIAVRQAESSMKLAKIELDRVTKLVTAGAIAGRQLDVAQNQFELAKGQYDAAVQSEQMAKEGTRREEIRAAEQAVAEAKAGLAQAKTLVIQAEAAALQVKVRKQDIKVAKAQKDQTSAAVKAAEVSLSYGAVTAPFSGRIVERWVDPGTMATPGAPLVTIEGGEYRLEAVVPEALLPKLKKGERLAIRVDALPSETFRGQVAEIVPQGDSSSHTFLVRVSLGAATQLKSGMFGRLAIPTGNASRLLIPVSATWEREGLDYVFAVNQDGIVRLRIITLGAKQGDRIEVLSGLTDGERIVVGDRSQVADGAKVGGL